jgi:hypothetical protein
MRLCDIVCGKFVYLQHLLVSQVRASAEWSHAERPEANGTKLQQPRCCTLPSTRRMYAPAAYRIQTASWLESHSAGCAATQLLTSVARDTSGRRAERWCQTVVSGWLTANAGIIEGRGIGIQCRVHSNCHLFQSCLAADIACHCNIEMSAHVHTP